MLPGYRIPTSLEYFSSLVASDEHFPLLEAAASLAMDEYPDLDVQLVPFLIDQLSARLRRRLPEAAGAAERLDGLNRFFYRDLGFGANLNHYHDPENSYLSTVLRTRRGIPVSLAVVWLELAHGIGLPAHGIGFPGHFLVGADLNAGAVWLDPLTGTQVSREELFQRLDAIRPELAGGPTVATGLDGYLRPAAPRAIVARMLRNLKEVHRAQEDWPRMLATQNRLVILLPQAWAEYRDRGLVHAELGDVGAAMRDLETYLQHADNATDHHAIQSRLGELRDARPD